MSRISEVTGLGKASLYHHFPGGKDEMAEKVLEMVETWIEDNLMIYFESDAPPRKRLQKVLKILSDFYEDGAKACVFDVLTVGHPSAPVQKSVRKSLERLLGGFERIALDVGFTRSDAKAKAEQALSLLQGSLVLSRALQDKSRFSRQMRFIESLFS